VAGHESLHPTKKLAANEDSRNRLMGSSKLVENGLDSGTVGLLVELHHGGANTKAEQEALGDGGHAAVAHAEDDHGVA